MSDLPPRSGRGRPDEPEPRRRRSDDAAPRRRRADDTAPRRRSERVDGRRMRSGGTQDGSHGDGDGDGLRRPADGSSPRPPARPAPRRPAPARTARAEDPSPPLVTDSDTTLPPTPVERMALARRDPPGGGGGRARLVPRVLLTVVALLAAAVIVLETVASPAPGAATAPVPQAAAGNGVWYCPATSEGGQPAVVSLTAAGEAPANVTIVRHTPEGAVAGTPETLEPGQQRDVALDEAQAGQPVSVRWSGGPAVASWRVEGNDAMAAPCAAAPSPVWYLTGLDTARGTRSTLHLFNPFGVDAVARITYATPEGPETLVTTDAELVPAHTSRRIDLTAILPEVSPLGVTVEVRSGRLVAQGEVAYAPLAGTEGPTGRALVPAAVAPSDTWGFGHAQSDDTSDSWLTIMNPGERDAAVEVQVSDAEGTVLDEYSVPAQGTTRVDLSEASGQPEFGAAVVGLNDVPVIAARVSSLQAGEGREGVTASLGEGPAPSWAVPGGPADGRASTLAVYNPGAEPVTASIDAGPNTPEAWNALPIGVNGRIAVQLDEAAPPEGGGSLPATVTADGDVVVELRSVRDQDALEPWTEVGVPAVRWTGPASRPPVARDPALFTRRPSPSPSPSPAAAAP